MSPCSRAAWRALTALGIATTAMVSASDVGATTCTGRADPVGLTGLFAAGIDRLVGADYQRAVELPDQRVLWLFQDAFIRRPDDGLALVHNVAVIQHRTCFRLVHGGNATEPSAWLDADLTEPMQRWFWPLGATIADDGTLRVFLAELRERGDRYLAHSEPVATWMATIDATTLAPLNFAPAPDNSPNLYGWSVVSDLHHTYLFGHCYRQFGFGWLGHDPCTAEIRVARVRRGHLDDVLEYWNGTSWVTDAASAVNIAPRAGPDGERRAVNPMQFGYVSGHWLAVTKEGDWWGDTIYLDRAPRPTGPWTTAGRLPATPLGAPDTFNTYFASLLPGAPGTVTIGLSNNRWDGHPSGYRPTFRTVPLQMWNPHTADPQPAPTTPINPPGAPAGAAAAPNGCYRSGALGPSLPHGVRSRHERIIERACRAPASGAGRQLCAGVNVRSCERLEGVLGARCSRRRAAR